MCAILPAVCAARVLGPYEIVAELERDERSTLYRARDPATGAAIALRVLAHGAGQPGGVATSVADVAVLLGLVDTPLFPELVGHGVSREGAYLAWRWCDGEPLASCLERGLTAVEVTALGLDLATALAQAHRVGVIHGELTLRHVVMGPSTAGAQILGLGLFFLAPHPDAGDTTSPTIIDATAPFLGVSAARDVKAWAEILWQCYSSDTAPAGVLGPQVPPGIAALLRRILVDGDGPPEMGAVLELYGAALDGERRSVPDVDDLSITAPPGAVSDAPEGAPVPSGRYVIRGELARGGMGAILRAHDLPLSREVAVKVMLRNASEELVARFVEEAEIQGQLDHPSICPVHELAFDGAGRPYFSMKLVRGRSLQAILGAVADGDVSWPLPRLLDVFVKISEAIAFAHSRGVIHRDLKPANVMVGEFGEVLVMDWGLAKVMSKSGPERMPHTIRERAGAPWATTAGRVMGTPQFMAPEQALGRTDLDERADIYALGGILYAILTLSPPIEAKPFPGVLLDVVRGLIVAPHRRAPRREVPLDLEAATLKALALSPADRYPTALALRDDVRAWLDGRTVSAARYSPWAILAKWVARYRAAVTVATLAMLLIVTGAIVYVVQLSAARATAEVNLAHTLLGQADRALDAGRWDEASDGYAQAKAILRQHGRSLDRAILGEWRLSPHAPAPLDEVQVAPGARGVWFVDGPDRLVVASSTITVWDVVLRTGVTLTTGVGVATLAAISGDGTRVAVAGAVGIEVWDLGSGARVQRWAPRADLAAMALDESGTELRLGMARTPAVTLDVGTGEPRVTTGPSRIDLALAVEGDLVLEGGFVGDLRVLSREDDTVVSRLQTDVLSVGKVLLLRHAERAVIARLDDARLELVQLGADEQRGTRRTTALEGHTAPVTSVSASADARRLLSTDAVGDARLWSLDGTPRYHALMARVGRSAVGALDPTGTLAAIVADDGQLLLVPAAQPDVSVRGHFEYGGIAQLALPPGTGVIAGQMLLGLFYADRRDASLLGSSFAGRLSLVASPPDVASRHETVLGVGDGGRSAIVLRGQRLVARDLANATEKVRAEVAADIRWASGEGEHWAWIDGGGQKLWNVGPTGTASISAPPGHVISGPLVMSADGRWAAMSIGSRPEALHDVWVVDVSTGEHHALAGGGAPVHALAFDSRGMLWSAAESRTVKRWDPKASWSSRERRLPQVARALGSAGRWMAAGDRAGRISLIDDTLEIVAVLPAHTQPVTALVSDGAMLASVGVDGELVTWALDRTTRELAKTWPDRLAEAGVWSLACDTRWGDAARCPGSAAPATPGSVEAVLRVPPAPPGLDRLRRTALHFAVERRDAPAVERALDAGADVDAARSDGVTPLIASVMVGRPDIARQLLARGASVKPVDVRGMTALSWALQRGERDFVEPLLAAGADPEEPAFLAPMWVAASQAWHGDDDLVHALLDAGAAPSTLALASAIELGHDAAALALVARGASLDARDGAGQTPLALAIVHERPAVLERLLVSGADIERESRGVRPLALAAREGRAWAVRALLAHGAAVEARSTVGVTALTAAVLRAQDRAALILIDAGAEPQRADGFGRTPLGVLSGIGPPSVLRRALGRVERSTLATRDAAGFAPLAHAVRAGQVELVEELLAAGAPPGDPTEPRSPRALAGRLGSRVIAERLEQAAAQSR